MEHAEFVCIACPIGCRLRVNKQEGGEVVVLGNACKRGYTYGVSEFTRPMRAVTSTVMVTNGSMKLVPVKTETNIDKSKVFDVMRDIRALCVAAPVRVGDVLIKDAAGTGVSIVATANVELD